MILALYITVVCYLPIFGIYLPATDFGEGIPDISIERLITYGVILLFIIDSAIRKQNIFITRWTAIIIIFSIYVFSSVSWSAYSYDFSVLQKLLDSVLLPLIIVTIGINLFRQKENFDSYAINVIIVSLILSVISLCQMFLSRSEIGIEVRSAGTLGNPNSLAIFFVLALPLLLYCIEKKLYKNIFMWLINIFIFAGLICTVSRKGMITFVMVYFLFYILKKQYKKVIIGAFAIFVLVSVLASYQVISGRFTPDKVYYELKNKNAMSYAGLQMFKTSPIIGLGFKGYYHNFWKYNKHSSRIHYDAHNMYITAIVNYGIVGFLLFMAILFSPLSSAVKIIRKKDKLLIDESARDMAAICICTVIPFMVNGFFAGGLFYHPELMFIMYSNTSLIYVCDEWQQKNI
ncbi:O-antigen ligase family protein [Desulfobacterales bacterium]|nr:O-antigen ligase family protein [Desulfobacterales bacterium]